MKKIFNFIKSIINKIDRLSIKMPLKISIFFILILILIYFNNIYNSYSNLIPKMDKNEKNGIKITSDIGQFESHKIWQAFDNNFDTLFHSEPSKKTGYLKIEFSKKVKVDYLRISPQSTIPSRSPKLFIFEGSNDDKNWTKIQEFNVADGYYGLKAGSYKNLKVNNKKSYLFYKFNFLGNDDNYLSFSELKLIRISYIYLLGMAFLFILIIGFLLVIVRDAIKYLKFNEFKVKDNESVIIGIIALIVLTAMYIRLYFGVDLADESFYLAMSYFFLQGGQPFINEWAPQQGASIIFAPFVKIYLLIIGSSEGIMLFGRHAYFLLSIFASFSIWRLCRRYVSSIAALFPAMLPLVFFTGLIPNISYNSLGAFGWLLGLGFIYSCYLPLTKGSLNAFIGAVFLVIASYSYPSLIGTSFIVICITFLITPKPKSEQKIEINIRRNHRISILLGVFLIAIPLLYITFSKGIQPLLTSYTYSSGGGAQGGGWTKLWYVINLIIQNWKYGAIVLSLLIFSGLLGFKKLWRWIGIIIGVILLIPAIIMFQQILTKGSFLDSSILVIWLGLLTPIIFLFKPGLTNLKRLIIIWPISILAGLLTAWTSSIWIEAVLGIIPAAVLSLYFVVSTWDVKGKFIRSVPLFLLLICIAVPQFLYVYYEPSVLLIKTQIKSGPFKGLFTAWKAQTITEVTEDLASIQSGRQTLFIINGDIPGAYLMTDLISTGPDVWPNTAYYQAPIPIHTRMFEEYFSIPGNLPDVIMVFFGQWQREQPLLPWFLDRGYIEKVKKTGYKIYVKKEL